jgi:acetyl esterase/lipase
MHFLRHLLILMLLLNTAAAQENAASPEKPLPRKADEVINIWQLGEWRGQLPGDWAIEGPEKSEVTQHMGGTLTVKNVSVPSLHYFKPVNEKKTRRAVIICPGGGYNILAWDLEGTEIAQWLNGLGYHAFVLRYRLPKGNDVRHLAALQDAQRAISVVRSQAETRDLAPDQIGIMGFSAGAHLSALAATNFAKRAYDGRDAIDKTSCRPDFAGLIYSAYLLKDAKDPASGMNPDLPTGPDTPPAFLVHTLDDPLPAANATGWALEMQKLKVPCELHLYAEGGHGYGLRSDKSVRAWPGDMALWLAGGAGAKK